MITVPASEVRPGDVLAATVHFVTPDGVTTAEVVTVTEPPVLLPDGLVRVTVGAELSGLLGGFSAWQDFAPDAELELRERGA